MVDASALSCVMGPKSTISLRVCAETKGAMEEWIKVRYAGTSRPSSPPHLTAVAYRAISGVRRRWRSAQFRGTPARRHQPRASSRGGRCQAVTLAAQLRASAGVADQIALTWTRLLRQPSGLSGSVAWLPAGPAFQFWHVYAHSGGPAATPRRGW